MGKNLSSSLFSPFLFYTPTKRKEKKASFHPALSTLQTARRKANKETNTEKERKVSLSLSLSLCILSSKPFLHPFFSFPRSSPFLSPFFPPLFPSYFFYAA